MATEYKPVALPECEALVDEPAAAEEWTGATAVDWSTGEVLRVHPLAARFPMMAEEDLADLAADIEANGLIHEIVLDSTRQLIDGRNRMSGCALARSVPKYRILPPGVDPVLFILSANVNRRHLSKGQKAMGAALGCNDSLQTSTRSLANAAGTSHQRVHLAQIVIMYAPDRVDDVMAGTIGLDAAYDEAMLIKKAKDECDETIADVADTTAANLQRIHDQALDLAELIAEERITLTEAIAVLDQREAEAERLAQEEQERRERATREFAKATATLHAILHDPIHNMAADWVETVNPMAEVAGLQTLWSSDGLADIAARLADVASQWISEGEAE